MDADYGKLWSILKEQKLKKKDLLEKAGLSSNIMAKMSKGQLISMDSLQKICIALNCEVGDIIKLNPRVGENKNDIK